MKNMNNEDSQKEKPTRQRRTRVKLTDEQMAFIKDFQSDMNVFDYTGRYSDDPTKPLTSAQLASNPKMPETVDDFDVNSINLKILGMDDDNSSDTKVDDVTKVKNDESTTTDDLSGIKQRVLSRKAKMDKEYLDDVTTSVKCSNVESSANATDATISTNATITADADMVKEVAEVTDADVEPIEPMKKESAAKDEGTPKNPQQSIPKTSRISAKMRKATRDEFHDAYLVKTDTKGGSPITIAADILNLAYRICSLSGDHKARPTYLINNLLREIFKELESDIKEWSKLD